MMRVGEGERLVVPVDGGVKTGESLRIAVRPEQVHIGLPGGEPNGGSRLTGRSPRSSTSACTRSSTSRRRSAASLPPARGRGATRALEQGARVAVSWDSEDAALL